jgi:hypothetical protein
MSLSDKEFRELTRALQRGHESYRPELEHASHPLQDPPYPESEPEPESPSKLERALVTMLVLGFLLSFVGLGLIAGGGGPWVLYAGIALIAVPILPYLFLVFSGLGCGNRRGVAA